ncbi:MAG: tetratricopeptide repeat protein [Deltaproteobacteria bacterium]|nr:tetratricopeptide repeat protein [Deltaproteobacteria bacterium]
MDDKELRKKFSDKTFLRQNEFANVTSNALDWATENKAIVIALVIVALLGVLGYAGGNYYQLNRVAEFNRDYFQARNGLQKEQNLQQLVQEYEGLPAAEIARLQLVDYHLEHNDTTQALVVLDQGLEQSTHPLMVSMLTLKKVSLLKKQNKLEDAIATLDRNLDKLLPAFRPQAKLIKGQLFLSLGQKDKAKELFSGLAQYAGADIEQSAELSDYDPMVSSKAKDLAFLIELGVL